MAKHEFGGDWTTDKLDRIRKYLCAYMRIFTKNPRARYFTTTYVDAFAGSGHRVETTKFGGDADAGRETGDRDADSFKKGSASIAIEVDPSFHRFTFIERDGERVKELELLRDQSAAKASDRLNAKATVTRRRPKELV